MDFCLYNETFDLFCNNIPKANAHILEIACGPGNITRYLLQKRPDFKILGIDIASNMLELAKANNPKAEFQLMDGRDISTLGSKFEAVMCGFCLPYLSKEEASALIQDAARLLAPRGILYISTMEDEYGKSGLKSSSLNEEDKTYTYYHQADYLTAILKKNNFEMINIQRMDFPDPSGKKTTDLILLAGL